MFAPIYMEGIGLHGGARAAAVVEMGLPGSGVEFRARGGAVPVRPELLVEGERKATVIAAQGIEISTVEHLMAALVAFGETDVRVTLEGEEIPILDGSALEWAKALAAAGAEQRAAFVVLPSPVAVEVGGSQAVVEPLGPHEEPFIEVTIDFDKELALSGSFVFRPRSGDFMAEVAPARTFAFASDVEALRRAGLARGGTLDNALVLGAEGPLNPGGMRFADEPARHKVLDAMGDLALLGGLPWAAVRLRRPGHRLLHALVRRIAAAGPLSRVAAGQST